MARGDDYNSASSQFFIVQEDYTSLDELYAVFGYVIEGIDVVDAVCQAAEPTDDNGTIERDAQPIITSITVYTPDEYEQLRADSTLDSETVAIDAEIAEVTAVNGEELSLTVYSLTEENSEYEITDVKDVDLTFYEATTETKTYTVADEALIYTVVEGELTEIDASDIAEGDMLVIYNDSEETVNIVVYHAKDEGDEAVTE